MEDSHVYGYFSYGFETTTKMCEYTKSWDVDLKSWDVDLFYSLTFWDPSLSDYPAKKWHRFIPQIFPYLKGDAFSKPSLFGIGIYFSNLGL